MVVYIASPFSAYAVPMQAVAVQVDTFAVLLSAGHTPVAPLLYHYVDQRHPATYERWMMWCLAMVARCDCVLRLPGESAGADDEVAEAQRLGLPVYFSLEEVLGCAPSR